MWTVVCTAMVPSKMFHPYKHQVLSKFIHSTSGTCLMTWKFIFPVSKLLHSSNPVVTKALASGTSIVGRCGLSIQRAPNAYLEKKKRCKLIFNIELCFIVWSFLVFFLVLRVVVFSSRETVHCPYVIQLDPCLSVVSSTKKPHTIHQLANRGQCGYMMERSPRN